MEAEEQWLPVPGYQGLYEVSDRGRVRSLLARRRWAAGRILQPSPAGKGYLYLRLCAGGARDAFYVAHLVLTAFVGPRPAGTEAAHGDGDLQNNRLSNLAWKTPAENAADKFRTGSQPLGEEHPNSKLTLAEVIAIRADPRVQRVIAESYGINQSYVSQLKLGRRWSHV